ncbi:RNA polymerase sigma factor [Polyangium jinanense]|uniref:RNA polymerase sigma factor n=1 Tax=Polyangium jinanense TaxID=2829994 RepID=UPI0023419F84|nr:RNA polymerase sigma factor [Polyangium jinanense]MDC3959236.1 RNA polymerase sigma factor [Polyangium jinanense]
MTSIPDASLIAPARALAAADAPPAEGPRAGSPEVTRSTLEALYAAHAHQIHRFLCDLLGDPVAARDATQETFVRAFQRLHTLEAEGRPVPWLFGIARHVSMEVKRARRRRRQVLTDDPPEAWEERPADASSGSPEEDVLGREALGLVQGALGKLSEDRRTVLLLRLDHDLCYEDIARTMGWSVPKVKIEIHRARQILRAELGEGGAR